MSLRPDSLLMLFAANMNKLRVHARVCVYSSLMLSDFDVLKSVSFLVQLLNEQICHTETLTNLLVCLQT